MPLSPQKWFDNCPFARTRGPLRKEVVDYVIDEGLYCILNVHHDTGASDTAWLVASEEGFAAASKDKAACYHRGLGAHKDAIP